MQFYLNQDSSGRGGPQVWSGRFHQLLTARGYQVTHDLTADWAGALFVNKSEGIAEAAASGKPAGLRVANGYLPAWFEVMGRPMKPVHHQANAATAQALEIAPYVIYQSQWAKDQLDALLYRREENFAIIPNGVDLNQFYPVRERPSSIPVLGSVGVMRYRYRLETILAASRRLDFDHKLLIVGDLDEECAAVLRHYQADPVVGPRITHQAHVPPGKLPDLYRQMDVLLHPVCGDVCPNVVVEALACGVPVVAPRFGGTAELVGPAGVIFDCNPWVYDDAFVAQMAESTSQALVQRDDLARLARRQAEVKLDARQMTDAYLDLLGLPRQVERGKPVTAVPSLSRRLRQQGARWIARPRFYTAVALRKLRQAQRRLFPPAPNPRTRIAFTLYDFHVGDIENWLYRLAQDLKDEFDFYFLATKVPDFLPKFHEAGTCAYLPGATQMIAYLQKHNIDLVQVHNERWPIDAALAAGVGRVIERTDGTRSSARVPKHGLSLVIASAQGTVPLIAEHIDLEKIELIYNGIDLDEVDRVEVERPFSPDIFLIGRTSRFGRGKNLGLLITAMERLHQRYPQLRLLFIGGDSLMPGAESIEAGLRVQAAPLGDRVQFLGVQANTLTWVHGFDVGTCVSDPNNEGIPNSLIEAMACRKPVIATDVDQVSELVEHEVNGLLIPPNDAAALCAAIERLAADPALCRRLGEAGRRTIEQRFSLPVAAAHYARIYRRLFANI
jgi:glycosyltransferase involved in cell wall biosynthesis